MVEVVQINFCQVVKKAFTSRDVNNYCIEITST